MKKFDVTIFPGRFQPLHKAHFRLILKAAQESKNLIIAIGSSNKPRTIKNPFTFEERRTLIEGAIARYIADSDKEEPLSECKVTFMPIRDYIYNDSQWAAELYSKALQYGATDDKRTCLIGSFKDDSSFYLNMFPQWSLRTSPVGKDKRNKAINATDIRDILFKGNYLDTQNLLDLIQPSTDNFLTMFSMTPEYENLKEEYDYIKSYKEKWAKAPFPPTFVTVDAVVIRSSHVLLIERGENPGKGLYALPGGFLNPNESIIDGSMRELWEETKLQVNELQLKETKVFDHPKRSLRGRTITHAFLYDLGVGALSPVTGSDDAKRAFWMPIADLRKYEEKFFEDHLDIITNLVSKY